MDGVVWAAIVAAVATIVVGLVGPFLGKRWNLPGLGREVQLQQAALITTLQGQVAELRAERDDDRERLAELEGCAEELRLMRRDLAATEREVLDLYRRLGERPPSRATRGRG